MLRRSTICWTFPILLTAGICLSALLSGQERAPAKGNRPEQSQTGIPQPINLTRCRIKLIDDVTLASGRTGVLAFVEPHEGDSVTKGQQVAGLQDDVPRAAFNVANKEASNDVEVRYSKKASELAEAEYQGALDANRKLAGTVPEIEVKKLLLAAERGDLQIEQAEHQFEILKLKRDEAHAALSMFQIDAPFDGVVTKVLKAKGEAVREGDPILEISSTARVKVEGYVNIKDVWSISQGCRVKVQLDIAEAELPVEKLTFDGRIVFVDVKVQPVTGEIRVWAEVANKDNVLRDGLTSKMTIYPTEIIPAQAAKN